MKVTYPLSLQVSLWLMLNLLLLAALGIGFFTFQGGLGWSALIAGPTGSRAQVKANIIAAEVGAAAPEDRTAVLERFKSAYRVKLFLLRAFDPESAATLEQLPAAVQTRLEPWRQIFRMRDFGPPGSRGSRGGFGPGPRERTEKDGLRREFFFDDTGRSGSPPPEPGRAIAIETKAESPEAIRDRDMGRFIERAGSPPSYWVAMRVPFTTAERGRPLPAMLVIQVDSFWALLHFLDLQSWIFAGTGVLLLSVLFWLPLVRSITRSVGQLTAATEQIAEGHFETRVNDGRRDELGKLGESVNRMAGRLDAHMNGQKRFLGDVAHELCSPLARLQMATGILADQAPKNLQETVSDVREEVQQMSSLVNELLAFTKSGLRARDVVQQPVELSGLLQEVLNRESATEAVTLLIPTGLSVLADPDVISRALGNLVRNAVRYAGQAGPITITAARQNDRVVIAVEDNGPGVPAADLDRLGEPFFRPELARTRESGGVGLGLAIVRNSVAACGGEVRFSNRSPQGFRAEIRLAAA
jgi:two-component system, OmpR family, sensor histidine kinase CpxA